jgi:hypothetical protein
MELTWSQTIRKDAAEEATAKAKTEGILLTLRKRNIALSEAQKEKIRSCTDLATLDTWSERAFDINHLDELW